eukprot:403355240
MSTQDTIQSNKNSFFKPITNKQTQPQSQNFNHESNPHKKHLNQEGYQIHEQSKKIQNEQNAQQIVQKVLQRHKEQEKDQNDRIMQSIKSQPEQFFGSLKELSEQRQLTDEEVITLMHTTGIEQYKKYMKKQNTMKQTNQQEPHTSNEKGDAYFLIRQIEKLLQIIIKQQNDSQDAKKYFQEHKAFMIGFSEFIKNSRNLNIEFQIYLEKDFPAFFEMFDQALEHIILNKNTSLSDQFFLFQITSTKNLLTQELYNKFDENFAKQIPQMNDLQKLRLHSYYLKSERYCQALQQNNSKLRLSINDYFESKLLGVWHLHQINYLHSQLALYPQMTKEEIQVDKESPLILGVLANLNKQSYQLEKLDAKTKLKLIMSLYYFLNAREVFEDNQLFTNSKMVIPQTQYSHLFRFMINNVNFKKHENQAPNTTNQTGAYHNSICALMETYLQEKGIDYHIEREKKMLNGIFFVDLALSIPELGIDNTVLEITNFRSKNFRTGFENSYDRIRTFLIQEITPYNKVITIDTFGIEDFVKMNDETKGEAIFQSIQAQTKYQKIN